jgi:DNA (cytosine-5)-methyltransferase 1
MADGLPAGLDGALAFSAEPDIPRIVSGVKDRRERLKALGNAVVPAQAYPIFAAIAAGYRFRSCSSAPLAMAAPPHRRP